MTTYAIIVAGGSGSRMKSEVPKQFMLLNGLPMMMHTIRAFSRSTFAPQVVVVLHPNVQQQWRSLCATYAFDAPHAVADGGSSRFESVKSGLQTIQLGDDAASESLIAVHDAVRPLVTPDLIDLTYAEAKRTGAAALGLTSSSSVRLERPDGSGNYNYPRDQVFLMQTPQTFRGDKLFAAYEQPEDPLCTDDASVVEKTGIPITIVKGDARNIKITFQDDLLIAENLLAHSSRGASNNTQ